MGELCMRCTKGGKPMHLYYTPLGEIEKATVSAIPGARPQQDGTFNFNLDHFLVDALKAALGNHLRLTDTVEAWYTTSVAAHRAFLHITRQDDVVLPVEVAAHIRNYQRIGALALAERGRMILADDMGLGKTLQALVAIQLVGAQRVLIVTLASLKWQWKEEIKRWLGEDAVVVDGSPQERLALIQSDPKYLLVNYEILRDAITKQANTKTGKPPVAAKYPELIRRKWDVVVFDEAHKLQGRPTAKKPIYQSEAAELVAKRADRVFHLTGTPIWNMLDSLWHLLHILYPDVYSSFWTFFVDAYCTVEQTPYGKKVTGTNQARLPELQERLSYCILQRTKEEVAPELPPKIFTTIPYQLSDRQDKEYAVLKKDLQLDYMKGMERGVQYFTNAPAATVAMRRLCNDPHVLGLNYDSPKDGVLLNLITNVLAHEQKVAVLCWHKDYAHHISDLLLERDISHVLATGETVPVKRNKVLQRFKQDDTRVLVGNIAAIGTGLNLAEISTAIFAELDWTPATNRQAIDRYHRLTSVRTVNIYYVIGTGTIEEHILQVTQKKAFLSDQALAIRTVVESILGVETHVATPMPMPMLVQTSVENP